MKLGGWKGRRGSTEEKNVGLEFRLYNLLLRNNQSKCITYKYDLWKKIIIIICNMLMSGMSRVDGKK